MILLDTCVILWLASGSAEISAPARVAIAQNAGALAVSAISVWEIGIKAAKKHLELPLPLEEWVTRACAAHGVRTLPVDHRVAARATLLPRIHADPADRFIIATAQLHRLLIVTPDQEIARYPDIEIIW